MGWKYSYGFFIFLRRYQQNKIVENYKMDMQTIEMHWKQLFWSFFFLIFENILELGANIGL
jgi:hypothetical protein